MSHLGSGHSFLSNHLSTHPRVQLFNTKKIYGNLSDLEALTSLRHKKNDVSAIYLEELLHNHRLTDRKITKFFKFVYLIREPKASLNEIIANNKNYTALNALRYYQFRLKGMFEYAKRSRGFFIDYKDLEKKEKFLALIAYLGLQDFIPSGSPTTNVPDTIPFTILKEAQDAYERYHLSFSKIFN